MYSTYLSIYYLFFSKLPAYYIKLPVSCLISNTIPLNEPRTGPVHNTFVYSGTSVTQATAVGAPRPPQGS